MTDGGFCSKEKKQCWRDENATDGETPDPPPLVPSEPSTSTSSHHHQRYPEPEIGTEPNNESRLCRDNPQSANNQVPSDEGTPISFLDNGQGTALNT